MGSNESSTAQDMEPTPIKEQLSLLPEATIVGLIMAIFIGMVVAVDLTTALMAGAGSGLILGAVYAILLIISR